MSCYNVMITACNSELGIEFVRQLLTLPHPPEHIFAVHTTEEDLNDLVKIQDSPKSKLILCGLDPKLPIADTGEEFKTKIKQVIGNNRLDLVINLICFTNEDRDLTISASLENHFWKSTLPTAILFQIMLPLLEDAALRNTDYKEETKAVFFSIIQDDSDNSNPISETNKVALYLTMAAMTEKVKNNNIPVLTTCLNLHKDNEKYETEIEHCVALNLLHALCFSQREDSKIMENNTIYKL